jgi:dTDP-4-dehydrorhamnose reductase
LQIHLIGCDGYIGQKLLSFLKISMPITPLYCYSPHPVGNEILLELKNPNGFDFNRLHSGDYIIFLAAISSPDICEKQFEYAYSINVTGTKKYIQLLLDRKANILFFSSDAVIGTTTDSSDENTTCNPIGHYAYMKREIEETFANESHFKVFRLSYVFSKEDKFTRYLYECDKEQKIADVFDALKRNVIYLNDILEAVQKLSDRFMDFNNTIFNLSGIELLSRKDLAELYQQVVNPYFKYQVVNPPKDFFKARPDIIETKSLYLSILLERNITPIYTAFSLEYNK